MSVAPGFPIAVVGGASSAAMAFRKRLARSGHSATKILVRRPVPALEGESILVVEDYFSPPAEALSDIHTVVNFAGLTGSHPEAAFRSVNVDGPVRLAAAAKSRGASRFVHISSLSVYGRALDIDRTTPEAPSTDYGRSKQAGDRELLRLADTGMAVTSIRAPTLYGRRSGQKLRRLARLMSRLGWFPVPRKPEPRSVLHVDNLALGIIEVVRRALDGIQFVTDEEPFTLGILAELVSARRNRPVPLVRLPGLIFSPLRTFLPQTYNSLFARSLVRADECVFLPPDAAVPLRVALQDVLPD